MSALGGQKFNMLAEQGKTPPPKPASMKEIKTVVRAVAATQARLDDRLDAIARAAKARSSHAHTGGGLLLDDGSKMEIEVSAIARKLVTPAMACFNEAKLLVERKSWEAALAKLAQLLTMSAGHVEGTYYKAYCEHMLGRGEPALETLAGLIGTHAPKLVQSKARILRVEVRGAMSSEVVATNMAALAAGQATAAIARMRKLRALDQEAALYHYLLAANLMVAGDFAEASAATAAGADVGDDDERGRLATLRLEIDRRLAEKAMEPARQLFRAGQYRPAREALGGLPAELRATPLCKWFAEYVRVREKGKSAIPDTIDAGQADQLFSYLVVEEVRAAEAAFAAGDCPRTERSAEAALERTPPFAYANFLCAHAAYQGLLNAFQRNAPPSLTDLIDSLQRTVPRARVAAAASYPSGAELLAAVEETLAHFVKLKKTLDDRQRDVGLVNGVLQEFNDIMQSAEGGISSEKMLNEIGRKMTALDKKLPAVVRQVADEEGLSILTSLDETVKILLKQLQKIRAELNQQKAEAGPIKELFDEFTAIRKSVEKGVRDSAHHLEVMGRVQRLKGRIPAVLAKTKDESNRKTLGDLQAAVDNDLRQLAELEASLADGAVLEPLFRRFTEKMQELERKGGVKSLGEQAALRVYFTQLRTDCHRGRGALRDAKAREQLDQLIGALDNVVRQLGG